MAAPEAGFTMMAAAALTAILLAVLISRLGLNSALAGGSFAFVLAVVFRVGGHGIHNGFAGRPAAVTLIDSGHDVLAGKTAAGVIIGSHSLTNPDALMPLQCSVQNDA